MIYYTFLALSPVITRQAERIHYHLSQTYVDDHINNLLLGAKVKDIEGRRQFFSRDTIQWTLTATHLTNVN